MQKCYNCGCEIDSGDKTRLCDNCKKVMLPFVKFMDASTSSSVRRLISNEKNLRNAGVTDDGMEYLLKICELHDKKKLMEREEREAKKAASSAQADANAFAEKNYSEVELPMDEPLNLNRKSYGTYLPAVEILLAASGVLQIAWAIYEYVSVQNLSVVLVMGSVVSFAVSYAVDVLRKMKKDLDEIKKRFR